MWLFDFKDISVLFSSIAFRFIPLIRGLRTSSSFVSLPTLITFRFLHVGNLIGVKSNLNIILICISWLLMKLRKKIMYPLWSLFYLFIHVLCKFYIRSLVLTIFFYMEQFTTCIMRRVAHAQVQKRLERARKELACAGQRVGLSWGLPCAGSACDLPAHLWGRWRGGVIWYKAVISEMSKTIRLTITGCEVGAQCHLSQWPSWSSLSFPWGPCYHLCSTSNSIEEWVSFLWLNFFHWSVCPSLYVVFTILSIIINIDLGQGKSPPALLLLHQYLVTTPTYILESVCQVTWKKSILFFSKKSHQIYESVLGKLTYVYY